MEQRFLQTGLLTGEPNMLKHILVPLDGSQLAEGALEHAKNIIGPDGQITLITVIQAPEFPIYDFYPTPTSVVRDHESEFQDAFPHAKEYLERIADDLKAAMKVSVRIEIEAGDAANAIVEMAEKLQVDAIVMSTHGRSGLGRWLFGSVTNKVMTVSPCPVYVIPNQHKAEQDTEQSAQV